MRITPILILLLLFLSACSAANPPAEWTAGIPACDLQPVKVPKLPDRIPASTELDEATGLHMTGLVQEIDLPSYRLRVTGLVDQPLSLTYDELRCLPKVSAAPLLICRGFFEDLASWSGAPIAEILNLAQPKPQAQSISLISADGFKKVLTLEEAMDPENFLAYELEGQTLPVLHGFPLRAVIPDKEGNFWVKWLVEIEVK